MYDPVTALRELARRRALEPFSRVCLMGVLIAGCADGADQCTGEACAPDASEGGTAIDGIGGLDAGAMVDATPSDDSIADASDDSIADAGASDSSTRDAASNDAAPNDGGASDVAFADSAVADSAPPDAPSEPDSSIVWSGRFEDQFNRPALDAERFGWRLPLSTDPSLSWTIAAGVLRVAGDVGLPGSTALTVPHLVSDQHVEVTIHRSDLERAHFTDIILRMDPTLLNESFYRVRIYQEHEGVSDDPEDPNLGFAGIQIAIFKISADGSGENGIVINDAAQPATEGPTFCTDCPSVLGVAANIHLRVVIDLVGDAFDVKVLNAADRSQVILEAPARDTTAAPLTGPGYTGLAHYLGVAQFDDFLLERR